MPDTAKANEPSGARNSRASRARTSSSSASISGSRWLTVGAAIARITRGDGQARARARAGCDRCREAGSCGDFLERRQRVAQRGDRRLGQRQRAAAAARRRRSRASFSAAFSPGTPCVAPSSRASGTSRRCSATRLVVAAGAASARTAARTASGSTLRQREDAADGADAQRRDRTSPPMPASTLKSSGVHDDEIGDLRDVAARFLHADDVRVRRQRARPPPAAGSRR